MVFSVQLYISSLLLFGRSIWIADTPLDKESRISRTCVIRDDLEEAPARGFGGGLLHSSRACTDKNLMAARCRCASELASRDFLGVRNQPESQNCRRVFMVDENMSVDDVFVAFGPDGAFVIQVSPELSEYVSSANPCTRHCDRL
jgi:hypothetical protein